MSHSCPLPAGDGQGCRSGPEGATGAPGHCSVATAGLTDILCRTGALQHPLPATAALTLNHCPCPADCLLCSVCVRALCLLLACHVPWISSQGPPHGLPARPPATAVTAGEDLQLPSSPMSGLSRLRPSILEPFQPSAGWAGMELLQAVLPEADFDRWLALAQCSTHTTTNTCHIPPSPSPSPQESAM